MLRWAKRDTWDLHLRRVIAPQRALTRHILHRKVNCAYEEDQASYRSGSGYWGQLCRHDPNHVRSCSCSSVPLHVGLGERWCRSCRMQLRDWSVPCWNPLQIDPYSWLRFHTVHGVRSLWFVALPERGSGATFPAVLRSSWRHATSLQDLLASCWLVAECPRQSAPSVFLMGHFKLAINSC